MFAQGFWFPSTHLFHRVSVHRPSPLSISIATLGCSCQTGKQESGRPENARDTWPERTDKTDKSPCAPLLSVLSVPYVGLPRRNRTPSAPNRVRGQLRDAPSIARVRVEPTSSGLWAQRWPVAPPLDNAREKADRRKRWASETDVDPFFWNPLSRLASPARGQR